MSARRRRRGLMVPRLCYANDPATPQSGNRGALIQEYITYGVDLHPTCSDFTNDASTAHFTFGELTTQEDYTWAILRQTLLTNIEVVRNDYGEPLTVDSGYRNPAHNATLQGASKQSQHMYGLAIDFGTAGNATAWGNLQKFAYTTDACVEPATLDNSFYDHIHMDWRAGYPGDCPTYGGTWGPH